MGIWELPLYPYHFNHTFLSRNNRISRGAGIFAFKTFSKISHLKIILPMPLSIIHSFNQTTEWARWHMKSQIRRWGVFPNFHGLEIWLRVPGGGRTGCLIPISGIGSRKSWLHKGGGNTWMASVLTYLEKINAPWKFKKWCNNSQPEVWASSVCQIQGRSALYRPAKAGRKPTENGFFYDITSIKGDLSRE